MSYLLAAILGSAAGLIGAVLWAWVTISTKKKYGLFSLYIGIAVGLSVRVGAGELTGAALGGLACATAVVAILAGKYASYELPYRMAIRQIKVWQPANVVDVLIREQAEKIVCERKSAGLPLDWPRGKLKENATVNEEFPHEVAQEAADRWHALPEEERQRKCHEITSLMKETTQSLVEFGKHDGFLNRFTFHDVFWIGVAGLAAFMLGYG
jgi:hypothetical protein